MCELAPQSAYDYDGEQIFIDQSLKMHVQYGTNLNIPIGQVST